MLLRSVSTSAFRAFQARFATFRKSESFLLPKKFFAGVYAFAFQKSEVASVAAIGLRTLYNTRWRLRRSTRIGGIAADHGATARAALSTSQPHSGHRCAQPCRRREKELLKHPRARLLIQHGSLEVDSPANASARRGSQRLCFSLRLYVKRQPSPQA